MTNTDLQFILLCWLMALALFCAGYILVESIHKVRSGESVWSVVKYLAKEYL